MTTKNKDYLSLSIQTIQKNTKSPEKNTIKNNARRNISPDNPDGYNFLPLFNDLEKVSSKLNNAQLVQKRLEEMVYTIGPFSKMYPNQQKAYEKSKFLLKQLDKDLKSIYKLSLKNLVEISQFISTLPLSKTNTQLKQ